MTDPASKPRPTMRLQVVHGNLPHPPMLHFKGAKGCKEGMRCRPNTSICTR